MYLNPACIHNLDLGVEFRVITWWDHGAVNAGDPTYYLDACLLQIELMSQKFPDNDYWIEHRVLPDGNWKEFKLTIKGNDAH